MHVVQPDFSGINAGKGASQAGFPGADGFDLGATQYNAGLELLDDVVFVQRFLVPRDRFFSFVVRARHQTSRSFWRLRMRRSAYTCPTSPPRTKASAM